MSSGEHKKGPGQLWQTVLKGCHVFLQLPRVRCCTAHLHNLRSLETMWKKYMKMHALKGDYIRNILQTSFSVFHLINHI